MKQAPERVQRLPCCFHHHEQQHQTHAPGRAPHTAPPPLQGPAPCWPPQPLAGSASRAACGSAQCCACQPPPAVGSCSLQTRPQAPDPLTPELMLPGTPCPRLAAARALLLPPRPTPQELLQQDSVQPLAGLRMHCAWTGHAAAAAGPAQSSCLEAEVQCVVDELALLLSVHLAEAGGGGGGGRAACVLDDAVLHLAALVPKHGDESRLHVHVGAHVHRLLLAPDGLGVGVAPQLPGHQVKGEGRQLLHAHDGDLALVLALLLALGVQLIEELAGAEDDALAAGLLRRAWGPALGQQARVVHDDALEAHTHDAGVIGLVVKLPQGGLGLGMAQQVLGGEDDKGLAELAVDLAPEHHKVVGGCGAVDNLPVGTLDLGAQVAACKPLALVHVGQDVRVLIRHLQEALHAPAAVLRPLAIIAVWQQHHQPGLPQPLGLAAGQELVKDDLRSVSKVPKLRLPQHQAVGALHAVAQLKAQHTKLRQGGVGDREQVGLLAGEHVGQGHVLLTRVLVVQDSVPVGECTALHILPTQAHVVALRQQGGKRQGLRHTPVHTLARLHHGSAVLVHLLDLLVGGEGGGQLRDGSAHLLQDVHLDTCVADAAHLCRGVEALPV
mmetsp:Transcript_19039/g.41041  ORF Transcript_19039/g.41041 Transcript_19039/m.41041 type:complete len:611 (-) Transcript_19039:1833-3665(-)